jgi:threonine aldolase
LNSSMCLQNTSVISAATGHIEVHEAGAVEATGHKITW